MIKIRSYFQKCISPLIGLPVICGSHRRDLGTLPSSVTLVLSSAAMSLKSVHAWFADAIYAV